MEEYKMETTVYRRMVDEYCKKSKTALANEIIALSNIECRDRTFANQCISGTALSEINEMFLSIENMMNGFTTEKAAIVYEQYASAKSNWDSIVKGLQEMKNDSRYYEEINKIEPQSDSFKIQKKTMNI